MNKKGLLARIIGAVLIVLSYVGLAFNFIGTTTSIGSQSNSANISLTDFNKLLEGESDKLGGYKTARVFMIITFVVIGVALLLTIVEMLLNNKVVSLVSKVVSIVGIVVSVVFFVCMIIGSCQLSASTTTLGITTAITYYPNVAPYVILAGALLGSACTLVASLQTTKKK